jgi:N-acetylglucosamine-6-phosphate deacetylase
MNSIEANIPGAGYFRIFMDGKTVSSVQRLGVENSTRTCCSAGFVDIQLNGFAGVDFSAPDLEVEAAVSVLPVVWATGVTAFCPTLISNALERLERNFRILETARKNFPRFERSVPCYHLEGPYLSPGASHGVHDPRWMRLPSWEEFARLQSAAGGNIGVLTIAPELPGALDLIRKASQSGVIIAIGHTDCEPEEVHQAVACGARLSTHLGNGCPTMIHRHLAPIWPQLVIDELHASIICDGFHLPADLVSLIYRMKLPDRCLLVTDAIHVANLLPGRYSLVGVEIELLPSGKVVTLDQRSMAGSSLSMNRAVSNFIQLAQASLPEGLRVASTNPACLLGRGEVCRRVSTGEPANLVLFRPEEHSLQITEVFLQGERVHEGS